MGHGKASPSARELQSDAQDGVAAGEVKESRAAPGGPSLGDATDGGSRSDRGESQRNAGGRRDTLPRKVHSFVSELEAATGNRLKAWGFTEEQRDELIESIDSKPKRTRGLMDLS